MEIIKMFLPDDQYVREKTVKKQIVLHHTVSGVGVEGDINWWKTDKGRVGTHYIIGRDGQVYQMLPDENWIYHLGLTNKNFLVKGLPYKNLDMSSIGIELDSYGFLVQDKNGKLVTGYKTLFPTNLKAVKCDYRGLHYFEDYYLLQINSLKNLLLKLCSENNIPVKYNEQMFDVNALALSGTKGIWSHGSYRSDKTDVYPNTELIKMLKSL